MKRFKKAMALLLSAVMMLAMSVTAFAAPAADGSLTVNAMAGGSLTGQDIYIFKLFDLEETDPADYQVNSTYAEELKEVLNTTSTDSYELYSEIAALGEGTNVQNFANDFTKKIITGTAITGTENTDYKVGTATAAGSYTFENAEAGYYLVWLGGSETIQSSLVTVNGDTTVSLKSDTPAPDKEADKADVQIGDVFTYTVTMKVPDMSLYNPDTYVFTLKDTLSAGLDFVSDLQGTAVTDNKIQVTVSVGSEAGSPVEASINGREMTLELADTVKANQDKIGQDITVTYYAKVNEDAVMDNTSNSAKLEYSNKPGTEETGESIPDIVKTPTFALNVHKFEQGKTDEFLAGASFQLHKDTAGGTVIKMAAESSNGQYVVAEDQNAADSTDTVITAGEIAGGGYNLQINGLAAGTYYLVETDAPEGFNLAAPVKIEITNTTGGETPSYSITVNDTEDEDLVVDVVNNRGTILPGTGGMGTVIFTIAGIVLLLGVGASFVISRRRKSA